jgi:hypothetical protein
MRLFAAATLSPEDQLAAAEAAGTDGAAFQVLVTGPARDTAGHWLLGVLDRLDEEGQVERLGQWLATSRVKPSPRAVPAPR